MAKRSMLGLLLTRALQSWHGPRLLVDALGSGPRVSAHSTQIDSGEGGSGAVLDSWYGQVWLSAASMAQQEGQPCACSQMIP